MAEPIDKLVVVNSDALARKYGAPGLASCWHALDRLEAADAGRGLKSRRIDLADPASMAVLGRVAVDGPTDEAGAKAAVDAACEMHTPDYVLLIDGPDVVPHVSLDWIPGLYDGDDPIPSDLPYASPAPLSRSAADFVTVTRVVGRLGAPAGIADPGLLIRMLDSAAARASRPASDYAPPFVICASEWAGSTTLSIERVYGSGMDVRLAPPAQHAGIDNELRRLAHFINCHGVRRSSKFYGQHPEAPVAMESHLVEAYVTEGAVVAAECCYGAELFDPADDDGRPPMSAAYLGAGAAGFLGSTTLSFGGVDETNTGADLLAQDFLRRVLGGASLGRALLEARQEFIRGQVMSDPVNLKTVVQFLLLGDPSWRPCRAPEEPPAVDLAAQRKARRLALHSQGLAVARMASRLGDRVEPDPELRASLAALQPGLDPTEFTVLSVSGGLDYLEAAYLLGRRRGMAVQVREADRRAEVLTAHLLDDRVVRVSRSVSR